MRMGVFGGTFNPIHNGHLHLLQEAKAALQLDHVLLIPTKIPPHKVPEQLASEQDRLEMCRLATQHLPWVSVSDLEMHREGPSYTVDTLRTLRAEYPQYDLYLLMGSDMLLTVERWFQSEQIAQMACVVGLAREKDASEALQAHLVVLKSLGFNARVIDVPPLPNSSTAVRAGDLSALPEAVADYIQSHHLYDQNHKLPQEDLL